MFQLIKNYYCFYLNVIDEDIDIEKLDHHNNNHKANHNMAENKNKISFFEEKYSTDHHCCFGMIGNI